MKHVMLDIETFGKGSFAVIRTIGAVKFDPNILANDLDDLMATTERFHARVSFASAMQVGQVDADTIEWWMKPAQAKANEAIVAMDAQDLYNVLQGFADWYGEDDRVPVWGSGATFDNVIIRNAYGRLNIPCPWKFTADRCFRTLKELWPDAKPPVGTTHTALDDALRQAWWTQHIVDAERCGYRMTL